MKAIATPSRTHAAPCGVAAAPRRTAFRAAARPSVRTHSVANDVGKYLSEAARQIFLPQASDVPWEASSQSFAGKIVHHEETARLKALQAKLDSAAQEIMSSMDEVSPAESVDDKSVDDSAMGTYVMTSIQKVFGNNFKGDESEPKEWASGGYKASGRPRSQRALRHEYQRLQRFQTVVKKTLETAEATKPKLEATNKDM